MQVWFAHAAEVEAAGLRRRRPEAPVLALGVGPARAAAALTAAVLRAPRPPGLVCLFGVAGAYRAAPGAAQLAVGDLCLVGREQFADEGVEADSGFLSLADLGLLADGRHEWHADAAATTFAARALGGVPVVAGATVMACSGTDERADRLARRTGASVESMEGAAVALACAGLGLPWVQLRCVGNDTGARSRARFALAEACARVQQAAETLLDAAWPQREAR